MQISKSFRQAIQKTNQPLYVLASEVGLHPSRLSRLKNGQVVRRPHDIRFKLLAELVDYHGHLFENEDQNLDRGVK